MGRGLVRHDIEPFARPSPTGLDLGRVADERDRFGPAGRGGGAGPAERLRRRCGQSIDIPDVQPAPGSSLVDLDREADALVHRHCQRLGATHPAEPGRQADPPRE